MGGAMSASVFDRQQTVEVGAMKTVREIQDALQGRRGVTVVEVLVMLVVLLALAALLIPSMGGHRRTSNTTECINNAGNLGKAILIYASHHNDNVPLLRDHTNPFRTDQSGAQQPQSWAVVLLPYMDQKRLHETLIADDGSNFAAGKGYSRSMVSGYTCPDSQNYRVSGSLSYVANVGYVDQRHWELATAGDQFGHINAIDWNDGATMSPLTETHTKVSMAAGVFLDFPATAGFVHQQNLGSMYDGVNSTLLFAENLQAGRWHDASLGSIGFAVGFETKSRNPLNLGTIGASDAKLALQLNNVNDLSAAEVVNGKVAPVESGAPRPSSAHMGGVVVTFCDGRSQFLSEQIDAKLYLESLTPCGARYGQGIQTPAEF